MSHPPETSRQLAQRIWVCADDHSLADDYPERWKEKATALIDAWVQKKIAEALEAAVNG